MVVRARQAGRAVIDAAEQRAHLLLVDAARPRIGPLALEQERNRRLAIGPVRLGRLLVAAEDRARRIGRRAARVAVVVADDVPAGGGEPLAERLAPSGPSTRPRPRSAGRPGERGHRWCRRTTQRRWSRLAEASDPRRLIAHRSEPRASTRADLFRHEGTACRDQAQSERSQSDHPQACRASAAERGVVALVAHIIGSCPDHLGRTRQRNASRSAWRPGACNGTGQVRCVATSPTVAIVPQRSGRRTSLAPCDRTARKTDRSTGKVHRPAAGLYGRPTVRARTMGLRVTLRRGGRRLTPSRRRCVVDLAARACIVLGTMILTAVLPCGAIANVQITAPSANTISVTPTSNGPSNLQHHAEHEQRRLHRHGGQPAGHGDSRRRELQSGVHLPDRHLSRHWLLAVDDRAGWRR